MNGAPWVTVELGGAVLHVPLSEGKTFTMPLTPDGAYALLGTLAEYVGTLKTPEVQRQLGIKALDLAINWFAGRAKGKR